MHARSVRSLPGRPSIALQAVLLVLVLGTVAPPIALGTRSGAFAPLDAAVAPGLRADLASATVATAPDLDRPSSLAEVGAAALRRMGPKVSAGHAKVGGSYTGRNHVWSQALGLNRSVAWFSCSRSEPPGMAVYRWGCAGANNVYLFAHAGGAFQRLHDLYVRGALRRGLTVTYADGNGKVATYAVAWWKVVLPTNGDFAFAAQSRPSMTLQTCVGANDRYRLVVRLYRTH